MDELEWTGDQEFRIRGVRFVLSVDKFFHSTSDNFVLVKHRHMVERYRELLTRLKPERIVELGLFEGGSAAMLSLLTDPERFVALDLRSEPVDGLEAFIDEHDLRDRVHTRYNADQSDANGLRAMLAEEFGVAELDLVIDDASHRLGPTRASFNVLFPRLRPGGLFVIEDWSGIHHYEAELGRRAEQDPAVAAKLAARALAGDTPDTPLSVMLFELVLAAAFVPDVFTEIVVTHGWACVERGPGVVDPETFDLSRVYSYFARTLIGRTD
jgi:predicted O-methyltransferase YrrM